MYADLNSLEEGWDKNICKINCFSLAQLDRVVSCDESTLQFELQENQM